MDFKPRGHKNIVKLMRKGTVIPNPLTLDIDDDVDPDRISGKGIVLHPGCRIRGKGTAIGPGANIGHEGPVTIDNCQIGPNVALAAGSFRDSVFLDGAGVGPGAQIRECCILEEESSAAHCVGLKQTILFPYVTLGSLINFCDCLMAGGTGRKDHSEVGSSYIHFNFTPDGDKATASLIGDVPRGVMLNQPRIFLGGQGGLVGPVRVGYGNVVAAGTVLRKDVVEENRLVVGKAHRSSTFDYVPRSHRQLSRIVENNILYLGNLAALEQWYAHVRRPFFEAQPVGGHLFEGSMDVIRRAGEERIRRLGFVADQAAGAQGKKNGDGDRAAAREFHARFPELGGLFRDPAVSPQTERKGSSFILAFQKMREETEGGYLRVVQGLPVALSKKGTVWLDGIVSELCRKASDLVPALRLFKGR